MDRTVSGHQPHSQDAVLGGVYTVPPSGVVLGGLDGVKQRLGHPVPAQRIAALQQMLGYGIEGLEAIVQALHDPVIEVQRAAYQLLRDNPAAIAQQALESYCPFVLFEQCCALRGHPQGITAVAISPDEQTIVSSSRDRTIHVWDLHAQESYLSFTAPFFVSTLTISPDGRSLVLRDTDHQLRVWSLRNGQELPPDSLQDWDLNGFPESSPKVASQPTDAMNQLTHGWLDDQTQWAHPDWLRTDGEQDTESGHRDLYPMAGRDRPKPRSIASTMIHGDRYLISSSQSKIRIWDLQQGREVVVLSGHTSLVTAIAAAPSGHWIISGSEDRTVGVWGIP